MASRHPAGPLAENQHVLHAVAAPHFVQLHLPHPVDLGGS